MNFLNRVFWGPNQQPCRSSLQQLALQAFDAYRAVQSSKRGGFSRMPSLMIMAFDDVLVERAMAESVCQKARIEVSVVEQWDQPSYVRFRGSYG